MPLSRPRTTQAVVSSTQLGLSLPLPYARCTSCSPFGYLKQRWTAHTAYRPPPTSEKLRLHDAMTRPCTRRPPETPAVTTGTYHGRGHGGACLIAGTSSSHVHVSALHHGEAGVFENPENFWNLFAKGCY